MILQITFVVSASCSHIAPCPTMAEGGEVEWELCKENIQPLRRGRKMSSLNRALSQLHDGDSTAVNQQRQYVLWPISLLNCPLTFEQILTLMMFVLLYVTPGPLSLNCECTMAMIHLMFGIGKHKHSSIYLCIYRFVPLKLNIVELLNCGSHDFIWQVHQLDGANLPTRRQREQP